MVKLIMRERLLMRFGEVDTDRARLLIMVAMVTYIQVCVRTYSVPRMHIHTAS